MTWHSRTWSYNAFFSCFCSQKPAFPHTELKSYCYRCLRAFCSCASIHFNTPCLVFITSAISRRKSILSQQRFELDSQSLHRRESWERVPRLCVCCITSRLIQEIFAKVKGRMDTKEIASIHWKPCVKNSEVCASSHLHHWCIMRQQQTPRQNDQTIGWWRQITGDALTSEHRRQRQNDKMFIYL